MIHESCCITGDVSVGRNAKIGPFVSITGPVRIGDGVTIGSHVSIGGDPHHRSLPRNGRVDIGMGTTIGEFVAIHAPTSGETRIDGAYVMSGATINHDCVIERHATVSPGAIICGHARIMKGSVVGAGATVRQRCVVGPYAMVGMGAAVVRDVCPLWTVVGVPAEFYGFNHRAIKRVEETYESIWSMYQSATGCIDGDHWLGHLRGDL